MTNYKAIIEHILLGKLLNSGVPLTGQSKLLIGLLCLSGLVAFIGCSIITFGAFLWLEKTYSTDIAAMTIGLALIGLSLVFGIIGWGIMQYRKYQFKKFKSDMLALLDDILTIADQELAKPVNDNPKSSIAAATTAGFIMGKKFFRN